MLRPATALFFIKGSTFKRYSYTHEEVFFFFFLMSMGQLEEQERQNNNRKGIKISERN